MIEMADDEPDEPDKPIDDDAMSDFSGLNLDEYYGQFVNEDDGEQAERAEAPDDTSNNETNEANEAIIGPIESNDCTVDHYFPIENETDGAERHDSAISSTFAVEAMKTEVIETEILNDQSTEIDETNDSAFDGILMEVRIENIPLRIYY